MSMIEASFEAVVPKAINAEFEAIIPREKAFDIVNKDIHIDTNGKYEVKADAGTAMTQVNVEVDIKEPTWIEPEESDVNFYDYDGTLLYAYKWEDAEKLTELPTLPNRHKGLVFKGWNYTLEDMLEQGNYANIGALYTTENGRTRIKVKPINYEVVIPVVTAYNSKYRLHWGDGESEIIEYLTSKEIQHTYPTNDEYFAEIEVLEGSLSFNTNISYKYNENIIEINFGSDNITIETSGLKKLKKINKVSFNNHINSINSEPMEGYLKCICLPSTNYIGSKSPVRVASWNKISIPLTLTSYDQTYFERKEKCNIVIHSRATGFNNLSTSTTNARYRTIKVSSNNQECYGNGSLIRKNDNTLVVGGITDTIENTVTTIGAYSFYYMDIAKLYISDSVVNIENAAFFRTENLCFLSLGKNVKSIGTNVTTNSTYCIIDATKCDNVPLLQGSITAKFVIVDDSKYDEFKVATNWSSANIVKKSETFINIQRGVIFEDVSQSKNIGYIPTKNVGEIQTFDNIYIEYNFVHYIIQVSGYDVLKITGAGGTKCRLFNFLTKDDIVLSIAPLGLNLKNAEIKIPKEAEKVIICSSSPLEVQLGRYDS